MRPPKILYVTWHWPLAPEYGAQQRVLNTIRLLNRFGDLSLVMVDFDPVDAETVRRTSREFDVRRIVRLASIASGNSFGRLRHRLRHELDPSYLGTLPLGPTDSDREAVLELIQQHDVVWIHRIESANLLRIDKWPHSVLDVDDLPSRVYRSSARSGTERARPLLDRRMSWIWRRRERLLAKRFTAMTVCSEDDRRYLGNRPNIHVIPNGFQPLAALRRVSTDLPRIGFIGKLPFPPNKAGVKWFIRDVWPLIKLEIPNAQLRLVGLGSDGEFPKLGPDITGLGWMQDPSDEIASWSAMIVPIQFGGGTRTKIAEGFARRCPIVSTTIGAFGYDVRNGEEILLADSARDFAAGCISLLRNPDAAEALAERAHKRFLRQWSWDSFQNTVGAAIQECMGASDRPEARRATSVGAEDLQDRTGASSGNVS